MGDETTTQDDAATATTTPADTARRRPWQRGGSSGPGGHGVEVTRIRKVAAQVLWAISALFALILAVAVLLIAVDANPRNDLVLWVIHRADNVDLGFFDLTNPIKDWDKAETNPAQDVKTALFNYGIAAIVWLGIGRLLERVVKP
jgi:hypothetical protein